MKKKGNDVAHYFATGEDASGPLSNLSRRDFLKAGGVALAGLALPLGTTSCDYLTDNAVVAVTRKGTIEEMVRKAVKLAGGLHEIKQGQTVLIKPNLVVAAPAPLLEMRVSTNPEVIRAVIKILKEKTDASKITVADKSAFDYKTIEMGYASGILQVCMEEGVNFLPLEDTITTNADGSVSGFRQFYDSRFRNFLYPIYIYEAIYNFDHIINVPMLKNHKPYTLGELRAAGNALPPEYASLPDSFVAFYANFTLSMKNWVGVMPYNPPTMSQLGGDRQTSSLHAPDLGEKIAELNLAIPKITMNIIDGTRAIVKAGPGGPGLVGYDSNIVIASKDRVACDTVGLAALKYYAKQAGISPVEEPYITTSVWDQAQIKRAKELEIGVADPCKTLIINDGVSEIKAIKAEWSDKGLLYSLASMMLPAGLFKEKTVAANDQINKPISNKPLMNIPYLPPCMGKHHRMS